MRKPRCDFFKLLQKMVGSVAPGHLNLSLQALSTLLVEMKKCLFKMPCISGPRERFRTSVPCPPKVGALSQSIDF